MNATEVGRQIRWLLDRGLSTARVAAIGRNRRTWTDADVRRVAVQPAPDPVRPWPFQPGGTPWFPPVLDARPGPVHLSQRMAEVLDGICLGLTNRAIADRLRLSEDTVKTHTKRLFAALGAHDRAHAAALACSGQLLLNVRGGTR